MESEKRSERIEISKVLYKRPAETWRYVSVKIVNPSRLKKQECESMTV